MGRLRPRAGELLTCLSASALGFSESGASTENAGEPRCAPRSFGMSIFVRHGLPGSPACRRQSSASLRRMGGGNAEHTSCTALHAGRSRQHLREERGRTLPDNRPRKICPQDFPTGDRGEVEIPPVVVARAGTAPRTGECKAGLMAERGAQQVISASVDGALRDHLTLRQLRPSTTRNGVVDGLETSFDDPAGFKVAACHWRYFDRVPAPGRGLR